MPQPIKLIIPDQWKSSPVAYERYAIPNIAKGSHTRTIWLKRETNTKVSLMVVLITRWYWVVTSPNFYYLPSVVVFVTNAVIKPYITPISKPPRAMVKKEHKPKSTWNGNILVNNLKTI